MVKKSPILVMMMVNLIGFILSLECGDQWFVTVDCPNFFPGYNTSFVNMTGNTIYNCVHQAEKEPTAKSLVFHKDSQTGQKTCYLYDEISSGCEGSVEGDFGVNKYLFKPYKCENGGSLTEDKLSCDCNAGYFGISCTELPTDCQDLKNRGIRDRGLYPVNLLPNKPPINLTCFWGRTVVMYQDINKDVNFTFKRSWAEYRDGFYGEDNFWLGLELMHILTTQKSQNTLDVSARIVNPGEEQEKYLKTTFTGFKVDGENTEFLMGYGGTQYVGNYLGELLRTLNNSRFSTYDRDNDQLAINCAMKYGGGWWYNNAGTFTRGSAPNEFQFECAPANPTGYFWNQCEDCTSEVKDISTGLVFNGTVRMVEMILGT